VSQHGLQQCRSQDLSAGRGDRGPRQSPPGLAFLEFLPDRLHHGPGQSSQPLGVDRDRSITRTDPDNRPVVSQLVDQFLVTSTPDTGTPQGATRLTARRW